MSMGVKSRVDKIDFNLDVGYKSHGWTLIKKYEHFNLWTNGKINECFFQNEIPNENAKYGDD